MLDHMKDAFDVHVEEEAVAIRPAIVTRQNVMKVALAMRCGER